MHCTLSCHDLNIALKNLCIHVHIPVSKQQQQQNNLKLMCTETGNSLPPPPSSEVLSYSFLHLSVDCDPGVQGHALCSGETPQ